MIATQFGTREGVAVIVNTISALRVLLARSSARLISHNTDEYYISILLFDAVRQSAEAFETLLRHEHYRDAFIVARTIFETTLNAAFISVPESNADENALAHARQKMHRNVTA